LFWGFDLVAKSLRTETIPAWLGSTYESKRFVVKIMSRVTTQTASLNLITRSRTV